MNFKDMFHNGANTIMSQPKYRVYLLFSRGCPCPQLNDQQKQYASKFACSNVPLQHHPLL